MSTKEAVLQLLEENLGTIISGEKLAMTLNISRTSIWKAIKGLQQEGHKIEAFSQKGYRLSRESDHLSESGICFFLKDHSDYDIRVLKTVDSTNQEAKRMLLEDGARSLIILAEEQTKGRGRRGRDFFSPGMTGIYLSMALKPDQIAQDALLITVAAAVGIYRAIKKLTAIDVEIKWVNDIYYQDRKIAGILTEGLSSLETGLLDYLIVGIGLNFIEPEKGFPEAFKENAGALFSQKPQNLTRNQLAAEMINQLLAIFKNQADHSFINEYRQRSLVIGERVEIIKAQERFLAKVVDIDQAGGLMIKKDNGFCETLYSGEISIRKMEK